MKKTKILSVVPVVFICTMIITLGADSSGAPTYAERRALERTQDAELERRIDILLEEMTLEEKIGQMLMINVSEFNVRDDDRFFNGVSVDSAKFIRFVTEFHTGSFLNGIAVSPETWYEFSKTIQELNLAHSRLKIPLIYGVDHIHGTNYLEGGVVFPHLINIAATFQPDHAYEMGRITGIESADLGHHWIFAPVMDLGRNPKFARFYETAGEDPYLAGRMGAAFVEGIQNNPETNPYKQAATLKHFIGYSDPKSGWDRTPVDISGVTMHEMFVPPFRIPIDAGAKTIMIQGGEVNHVPVHASYELLTTLLRNTMNFKGVAVTDWRDVERLWTHHNVAADMKEAVLISVNAGIDISMAPFDPVFHTILTGLVREGRISEDRIDLSVARVLRLKLQLGLFENPLPGNDRFDRIGREEYHAASLRAARESLVLLKNDNILPLRPGSRILLAGMNADTKRSLTGGWTYEWSPSDDTFFPPDMQTLKDALREKFDVFDADQNSLKLLAASADAIVIATGEHPYAEGYGDIVDQNLDVSEQRLIGSAIATGKPVVVVMIAGRPRLVSDIFDAAGAFIWAGLPGQHGARAITDVLSGEFNPEGRLPFSYPRYPAVWFPYNHKATDRRVFISEPEIDVWLAPFGSGLSYTEFGYSDLVLSDTVLSKTGRISASVTVTNNGYLPGTETVLWYLRQEVAPVTRPVKALKHFEKQELDPGVSRQVSFEIIPEEHLWFPDDAGSRILNDGYFRIFAGDQEARFRLTD